MMTFRVEGGLRTVTDLEILKLSHLAGLVEVGLA